MRALLASLRERTKRRLDPAELAVVVVLAAAVSAILLRQYHGASVAARDAAALGVAGQLAANAAINAGERMAKRPQAQALAGRNVCSAQTLQTFVDAPDVTLTSAAAATAGQFQVGGSGDCSATAGNVSVACTVTPVGGHAARVTIVCAR